MRTGWRGWGEIEGAEVELGVWWDVEVLAGVFEAGCKV